MTRFWFAGTFALTANQGAVLPPLLARGLHLRRLRFRSTALSIVARLVITVTSLRQLFSAYATVKPDYGAVRVHRFEQPVARIELAMASGLPSVFRTIEIQCRSCHCDRRRIDFDLGSRFCVGRSRFRHYGRCYCLSSNVELDDDRHLLCLQGQSSGVMREVRSVIG